MTWNPYLVARRALRFKRGQRKCSCIGGQIFRTKINNNHWKLIYVSRTIPSSQYETNLWSTHVNIVRLAEPIRRCVRWRTQGFKIEGLVCKRFLLSPPPPPTFIFWLLFHFSRGQNRGSRSSIFLYSETKRKRLLRRLRTIMYPDKIERRNEGRLARVHRPFGQTDYFVANERFAPVWANTWQSYTKNKL